MTDGRWTRVGVPLLLIGVAVWLATMLMPTATLPGPVTPTEHAPNKPTPRPTVDPGAVYFDGSFWSGGSGWGGRVSVSGRLGNASGHPLVVHGLTLDQPGVTLLKDYLGPIDWTSTAPSVGEHPLRIAPGSSETVTLEVMVDDCAVAATSAAELRIDLEVEGVERTVVTERPTGGPGANWLTQGLACTPEPAASSP